MDVRVKRIYEAPEGDDGHRVLVDRLWPRGMSKERARLDRWMREIGPSDELRAWFGHDPDRWEAFVERYRRELDERPDLVGELERLARDGPLTLLYSARDEAHNQAVALRGYLEERIAG